MTDASYRLPLKLTDYKGSERGGCFFVRDAVGITLAAVYYDTSGDPVSRSVRKMMVREDALLVAQTIARALSGKVNGEP